MALNYEILNPTSMGQGAANALPLPVLPAAAHGQRLALNTNSNAIQAPCELCIMPDEDVWLDCQVLAANLAPNSSALLLKAGVPRYFAILGSGAVYLKAVAV